MGKEIILQKIPIKDGWPTVRADLVQKFHDIVKNELRDEYILVTSPFELNSVNGDSKIIRIDCKEYSYNELMDIIEKATMYEDLC